MSDIIAAGADWNKSKHLSELLITHVGNFRKMSERLVVKIIDSLHNPYNSGIKDHETNEILKPLKQEEINMMYGHFMHDYKP